jgi:hypothetical protein
MSVSLLENLSHYPQAQASRPENDRAVRPLAITISREAGAGAITIAELVRQRFNAGIDEPTLYDVTLNTGRMGFVRAAEAIAEAGLRHHRAFAEREGS